MDASKILRDMKVKLDLLEKDIKVLDNISVKFKHLKKDVQRLSEDSRKSLEGDKNG